MIGCNKLKVYSYIVCSVDISSLVVGRMVVARHLLDEEQRY